MNEMPRLVLLPLPTVLGVDLSVTYEVVLLWAAAVLAFVVLTLACRRTGLVARGAFQNLFEAAIEWLDAQVLRENLGRDAARYAPLLLSLFFFILFANLLGLLPPATHLHAATSNLAVTAALSLLVFLLTVAIGLRRHGPVGFARRFVPAGIPWAAAVLAVPIEVLSWLTRPVSLSVRLFANMMAGHALILAFLTLAAQAAWFLAVLPLAGAVIMSAFELFVCVIQAFVFMMLTTFYIRDALDTTH